MGRRKPRNIKIREDRLDKLDTTKMEVAIWLLAKGAVEDRTQRSQLAPPTQEVVDRPLETGKDESSDTEEGA